MRKFESSLVCLSLSDREISFKILCIAGSSDRVKLIASVHNCREAERSFHIGTGVLRIHVYLYLLYIEHLYRQTTPQYFRVHVTRGKCKQMLKLTCIFFV